jgi:hypothetical protein
LLQIRDIGLADSLYILAGGRRMENRKFQFMDRRQDMGMTKVTFKDSNGVTVRAIAGKSQTDG